MIGHVLDGDSIAYVMTVSGPEPDSEPPEPFPEPFAGQFGWVKEPWVDFRTLNRDTYGNWRTMLDGGLLWRRGPGISGP